MAAFVHCPAMSWYAGISGHMASYKQCCCTAQCASRRNIKTSVSTESTAISFIHSFNTSEEYVFDLLPCRGLIKQVDGLFLAETLRKEDKHNGKERIRTVRTYHDKRFLF
jgi:hypothetical protein